MREAKPVRWDVVVGYGTGRTIVATVRNAVGDLVDTTNYGVKFGIKNVREDASQLVAKEAPHADIVFGGVDGTIAISFTGADSITCAGAAGAGSFEYDAIFIPPAGVDYLAIEGNYIVKATAAG